MKRSTILLVILALLFSLFSCSENTENGEHSVDAVSGEYNGSSEDSKSVFFGDIEVPGDAECPILVSGTFNLGDDCVCFSSQVHEISYDDEEKIKNRRFAKITEKYPPQDEMQFSFNGISENVPFSKGMLIDYSSVYFYENENVSLSYFARSSALRSYHILNEKLWNTDGKRVVNSNENAIEYAMKFMQEKMDIYKLDEYKPTQISRVKYTSINSYSYDIQFVRLYKGLLTSLIIISITEQGYVSACICYIDKEELDFLDRCIDYATELMSDEKALTALQSAASSKPEIASIRNVSLYNFSSGDMVLDDFQKFSIEQYGIIEHNFALDKTEVCFYYSYTAVMKDGSEKQGFNVISVFLPIDWAEVYGEKESA